MIGHLQACPRVGRANRNEIPKIKKKATHFITVGMETAIWNVTCPVLLLYNISTRRKEKRTRIKLARQSESCWRRENGKHPSGTHDCESIVCLHKTGLGEKGGVLFCFVSKFQCFHNTAFFSLTECYESSMCFVTAHKVQFSAFIVLD